MNVTLDSILAAQKKAYEFKTKVAQAELLEIKVRENAEKDIHMAEVNVAKTKSMLMEKLQYLQDYNSGPNSPHENWFEAFGVIDANSDATEVPEVVASELMDTPAPLA